MNRLTLIVVILFLLGLSGISCSKKPAAIVNGEEISLKEFNQKLKQRMESHKVQGADIAESKLKDAVLDEIIGNRLLLQGAREKNINVADKEIDEEIASIKKRLGEDRFNETLKKLGLSQEEHRKQVRERLTINKFIESLVSDDSIKEEDIKKYYKESPTPMMKPERVYVKLIQVPTREEGEKIIKEMKEEGLDFDALGL
jgi:parvulin-like peptidyl-prolyl isomerase